MYAYCRRCRAVYDILALHQDREQLLLDVAAAIPALVYDERLLFSVFVNFFLELR